MVTSEPLVNSITNAASCVLGLNLVCLGLNMFKLYFVLNKDRLSTVVSVDPVVDITPYYLSFMFHNSSLLNNVEGPLWFKRKRFPKKFVPVDYFKIICEIIVM